MHRYHRLHMRLPILCLALCQLIRTEIICNSNTTFECSCDECWDTVASEDTIDWLSIGFSDCPPQLNETRLRTKLAGWINEECGASLNCNLSEGLIHSNIVIGEYACDSTRRELRMVALRNSSQGLREENVLPASLVGLVLQSREHLLSFLLHSELHAVTVHRRFRGTPSPKGTSIHLSLILFTSLFIIFLVGIALLVYFSQIYINWRRIVKGKWDSKEYRKVPNVRYNIEELESTGHI